MSRDLAAALIAAMPARDIGGDGEGALPCRAWQGFEKEAFFDISQALAAVQDT